MLILPTSTGRGGCKQYVEKIISVHKLILIVLLVLMDKLYNAAIHSTDSIVKADQEGAGCINCLSLCTSSMDDSIQCILKPT